MAIVKEEIMDFLGIIPARGGSKGVPRKNIKIIRGAYGHRPEGSRLTTTKYGITDIRLLYENDVRFLGQFR